MNRPSYVAIEGVIGVGKTTLARLLQPRFNAELLLEVFEENPFLSDFYADRERYAFQTQIFFLLSRYRQQQALQMGGRFILSDYTFAKDRLFARLNLCGDELAMYERVHRALAEKVVLPDLVVYLQADLDVLMARIATRDRPYERQMEPDYIESLRQAYEQHFADYESTPLLVIDTNRLDFVRNQDDLAYVEARMRAAVSAVDAQARVQAGGAEERGEGAHRWPLVDEFLALTQSVGALGAALSDDAGGASSAFREALTASRECLERIERRVEEGG